MVVYSSVSQSQCLRDMGKWPWLTVTLSVSLTSLSAPALCGLKAETGTEVGGRELLGMPREWAQPSLSLLWAHGRAQQVQPQGPKWLRTSEDEKSSGQVFAKCLSCQLPLFTLSALENYMSGVSCNIFMAL